MSILTSSCSLMCPNLIFSANIQEFIAGICRGLSVFAYTYVFPVCSYVHYGTSFHRERKKFTKIIWQVNSLNFKLGYVCSYNPDTIPQLVLAVVSLVAVVNNIIVTVVLLGNYSKLRILSNWRQPGPSLILMLLLRMMDNNFSLTQP